MGSKIMSVLTVVHVSETVGSLATYGIIHTIFVKACNCTEAGPFQKQQFRGATNPGPGPRGLICFLLMGGVT